MRSFRKAVIDAATKPARLMRTFHRACAAWLVIALGFGVVGCGKRPAGGDARAGEAASGKPVAIATESPLHPAAVAADSFSVPLLLRLTDPVHPEMSAIEAVSWLAAGLRANPESVEFRQRLRDWLTGVVWQIPVFRLPHPGPVDLVDAAGTDTLWVVMSGENHAVVRWDLTAMKPTAVGFPVPKARTEFWKRDPLGRRLIIGRGGVRLLGDAVTLKPVCSLSGAVGGEALTSFSPEGLLLAHPVCGQEPTDDSSNRNPLRWVIRDALSGTVIREETPDLPVGRRELSARIDRNMLEVRLDDGSSWCLPVSPIDAPKFLPADPAATGTWLAAWHPGVGPLAGHGWCGLRAGGDHAPAEWLESMGGRTAPWVPDPRQLLAESPWSLRNCVWNGPPQGNGPLRLEVRGRFAFPGAGVAPLQADAAISSLAALHPGGWVTASSDGMVVVHRMLPEIGKPGPSMPVSDQDLAGLPDAIDALVVWLGGGRPEVSTGEIRFSLIAERAASPWTNHLDVLARGFPGCDLASWAKARAAMAAMDPAPDRFAAIHQRLARMQPLADTHTMAALETLFRAGNNDPAVLDAIRAARSSGAAAAMALKCSLAVGRPDWIRACLSQASGLPATLQRLAQSRIDWFEGNPAAAFESWPHPLPDLADLRRAEDWDGWEQVDFTPEYESFRQDYLSECGKLTLPSGADAAAWEVLVGRLTDSATAKSFGASRVAQACLDAATHAPVGIKSASVKRLADTAESLGAARPACLRAGAIGMTAGGNYRDARELWVELITLHPIRSHLPGDYAEAAYTAFENSDPRQAMAILATGMHRFPDDARFALRAGWVALLTGNPQPAYRFLLAGQRIGFPAEVRENATALLAAAAGLSGAPEDAAAFFQDLIALSADWNHPATIDSLAWPEELKSALKSAAGW